MEGNEQDKMQAQDRYDRTRMRDRVSQGTHRTSRSRKSKLAGSDDAAGTSIRIQPAQRFGGENCLAPPDGSSGYRAYNSDSLPNEYTTRLVAPSFEKINTVSQDRWLLSARWVEDPCSWCWRLGGFGDCKLAG